MKDIQLNKLDASQRRLLQTGVILILLVFLGLYFFFNWRDQSPIGNSEIYLENNQLHIFNDTYTFNGYPDKILVHYPYLLYVQGNKPLTTIYNLETKEKEKEIIEVLLDYHDGNMVYNKKETYFNDKNLGEYCDAAFIKSEESVLCITKQSRDFVDNMLIDINPDKPNLWARIYKSDNVLTNVSVINDKLYVGEINFETKQNYLSIDQNALPVESPVSLIYQLDSKPYFASFKSELNNNTASYFLVEDDNIVKQADNKIYFSR